MIFNFINKIKNSIMSNIIINGKSFTGRSININKNKIIIDCVDVTPEMKQITIQITGDIDKLYADFCDKIMFNGNINNIDTVSADIECKDVKGRIRTSSGDIECGNIGGDVQTMSGDIKAENITGTVKTLSGDIKYKK